MAYTKNKEIVSRIVHKHDIEANWENAKNFIPMKGEIIVYDIDKNYNYERFKIGDGVTTVINLPFQKTNINDLKAVSYDIAQELTDEQKIQARANIGAGTPDSIKIIEATYYANGESTISSTEEEINALIAEGKNVCIDCFIEPEDRTFRFYFSTKTSSGTTLFVNTEVSDGAPELKLLTLIGSTFMIITMPVPLRSLATESKDGLMSTEDKVKLDSIEEGAQVNVQSDWNQLDETQSDAILNKPFGEYKTVTELLAETEVTGTESDGAAYQYVFDANPFTGDEEKISVTFDGVEYVCNKIVPADGIYMFGNMSGDTGEPFIIEVNVSQNACVMILHDLNPHTISISEVNVNIKAIDPKYLPKGYPYEEVTAIKYDAFGEHNIPLALGQVWEVSYDTYGNRKYDTHEVQVSDDGTLYLGDLTLANKTPYYITATGCDYNLGWYRVMNITNAVVTCVSGAVTETIIHPMDEKFLPSSATAQSDWFVNDENDPAYVKNRTHYDDTTYIIRTQNDIYQLVNTAISGTSLDDAELIEGLTFRVIVDGVVYDNVPIYYNCYIAGGKTWAIGDSYSNNKWRTTDYGFCYHGYGGWAHNSDIFPNGIENIEVYTVERELKQLDPKYIKDMYHEESSEVFSIENAEFNEGSYLNGTPFIITDGNIYVVNWDGTEYTCAAYTLDAFPVIGNTLLFGGTGNGEPFFIMYDSERNVNFIAALNDDLTTDGSTTTHTFSVAEIVAHTIDHKYIKDMYYDNGSTTTLLVDNQTVTGFEVREDPLYAVQNPFSFSPTIGATYTVTWDGTDYECTAATMSGMAYIGNVNYVNMQSGGDIPFAIVFAGAIFLVTESTEESHTISITEVVHDMKQLDEKYLPILEEVNKTVFSMDTVVHDNEYDLPEGMLVGPCKVMVDGVSEDVIFVVDTDYSFANTNSYHIETWEYGIYFEFQDDEPHSVKIEIPQNVIKEEYLPENVTATPNWNAAEGENGYIENRTHYEAGERTLISKFDKDTNKMTPAKYLKDTEYIVIVNGVRYVTSVGEDYLSNMRMYATFLGSAPWNVSNEGYSPISLYISGGSYPDISSSEVELSFTCKNFDNNNDYSIEVYLESSDYAIIPLDEKFLPDVAKNAVQYVEQTLSLTKQMQARNNIGAMHNPTAANIGQLIRVSSVDENGRPTDWEPFDFYLSLVSPDGTEWAMDVTDNGELTLSKDDTFREILEGTITNIKSDAIKIGTRIFYGCTELTTADFSLASNIDTYAFYGCSNLSTFILRNKNTMCTLVSTTAFTSTPIASGTGYIYVPSILVDSYKTATNWSKYANQFRAIEDYPDIYGGEM